MSTSPRRLTIGFATHAAIRSVLICLAVLLAPGRAAESPPSDAPAPVILWTPADALMPAWGVYPNAQAYGGTPPLGRCAAWTPSGGEARLTWVADLPAAAMWQVWVRKYGGYGQVTVELNEQRVTGGRGGPGGGRYVWQHLGAAAAPRGTCHVDIGVTHGMFDAVLLVTDGAWSPDKESLPEPVKEPVLRAPRTYRDDTALRAQAGRRGLVVGQVGTEDELLDDWLPAPEAIAERMQLWGAAGQYVSGTAAVRALDAVVELHITLAQLVGPHGFVLGPEQIDLRVVLVRARRTDLFQHGAKLLVPELLLRDDRTGLPPRGRQGGFGGGACTTRIPAHTSRQVWLTVHLPPQAPPGKYTGTVAFAVPGAAERNASLPVEIDVLPIDLRPAEGYYSIYYPSQPVDEKRPNYVSQERYLAELKDQARHGLNAVTLYGGFATLDLARQAGLLKPPCLMHWPDGKATEQVQAARAMGFEDLYYYGVDEPREPAQIERCRKEAERRRALGLHMMTAINSRPAQEATRDFIDRPVYNLYVFGGPDNAAAQYVVAKGFRPISYWTTATTWPLWFRALTGLYNKRCGYLGSAPWAYQDYPDDRLYDPDAVIHRVSYPDESGEPIPTVCWEAHRAGIDDVRYLEALDRALMAAAQRLQEPAPPPGLAAALSAAREVRRQGFESISGRWFEYLGSLQPGRLDQIRRQLADAVVALEQARR